MVKRSEREGSIMRTGRYEGGGLNEGRRKWFIENV